MIQDTTTGDEALPAMKVSRKGERMPNGSYPIRNATELDSAVRTSGMSRSYSKAQVKSHIIKRANALGLANRLPAEWKTVGQEGGSDLKDTGGDPKQIVATLLLEDVSAKVTIVQDEGVAADGSMKVRVPFFVGGSLAKAPGFAEKIYFPTDSLPRLIQEGNAQIGEGKQPLTVYARHKDALDAKALPIGKVVGLEQEDRIGYAILKVSPTAKGKDVQVLIKDEALNAVSLRTERFTLGRGKVDGKQVLVFENGSLLDGIDFAPDSPAQPTYGVEVLAQEARVEPAETNRRRNLSEPSITLEEIPADLVKQIAKPLEAKVAALEAEVKTLRQEKALHDRDVYLHSIADKTVKPEEAFTALVTLCNEKSAVSREAASPVVTPFLLQALEDARTQPTEPRLTTAEMVRELFVTRTPEGSGVAVTQEDAKPALTQEEIHPFDKTASGLALPEDY